MKLYPIGLDVDNKMVIIDSNVLVAMCQYYYKGKCDRDELTDEIKDFIYRARNIGINNGYAITELCYDYNVNRINVEQMNLIMLAFDNLIKSLRGIQRQLKKP